MSSAMDPAKMKVVDLRQELANRGLDTKGVKAALVKRLKDALEEELKQDLPDTSIADTSTEDLDTSQGADTESQKPPPAEQISKPAAERMEVDEKNEAGTKSKNESPQKERPKPQEHEQSKKEEKIGENGEHLEEKDDDESKVDEEAKSSTEENKADESSKTGNDNKKSEESKTEQDSEQKGEKRKRDTTSPERSQKRREKSPIKEDEPTIDNDKVQLSWYDSDLHLQLDKESFLSAKPLTEGVFGYVWAGARATHGISSGKVCYEVKITEEVKWEDVIKPHSYSKDRDQQRNKDKYRTDHRRDNKDKKGKDSDKKSSDKSKSERDSGKKNEDKKDKAEKSDEKMDTSEPEKPKEESDKNTEEIKEEPDKVKEELDKPKEEIKTEMKEELELREELEKVKEEPKGDSIKEEKSEESKKEGDEEEKPAKSEEDKPQEEKMETEESKTEPPSEPIPTHLFRVGFSLSNTGLQLGESKHSYGYDSSGKFATDKQFTDYGITFGVGDVVGAFLNIDDEEMSITYTVNGQLQPTAITIPCSELPEDFAFFPHVMTRNYVFELNFGGKEEPWFPIPEELQDYPFLDKIEDKVAGPIRPENRNECEIIMMFGLPASGKTHWVREHVQANPEKRYNVIGNTTMLEKMTVFGEPLKSKYKGKWNVLIDKLQKCLNKMLEMAPLRRRNFIIDQTNVFPSAQRRKLRPFEGFKRRAVVLVVGDDEQARRQSLQEAQDGKDVPECSLLELKGNMSLPEKCEWIDEVTFAELKEDEAKEVIKKYNTAGKEAGYGRKFRRDDRRGGYGNNYRDRNYGRYDRRPPPGNWNQRSGGGGGGWRDRRDNRGPPPRSRDWDRDSRGGNRSYDRNRDTSRQGSSSYSRSRGSSGGQRPGGGWHSSSGGWSGQGSHGSGGGWNQQTFGHSYNQWGSGQGGGSGQSYKYSGQGYGGSSGGGSGGYGGGGGSSWNYYNQY